MVYLRVIEMEIVFWTGLLSFITQYSAVIVITIFIVDFFSYRSKKALLIATFYFFLLLVINSVIANFLLQTYASGALHHVTFQHCYSNILLATSIHVFFGLLIFCLYLKSIALGAASLAVNVWNNVQNRH